MKFLRSIRLRLTLWYVLLLAIILVAFSAGIYLTLRHSLYANLDDSIEARANDLLPLVQYENGHPTLSANIAVASSDLSEELLRVYDAAGAVTFDTSAEAGLVPDNQLALRGALSAKARTLSLKVDGESFRALVVPIERAGQVTGALEVGRAAGDVTDTLRALLLILAVAYPVTLAVASSGGIFLGGRALSPINRLTRLARRISAEDLSQRLDMPLPDDEVGQLAHTFNDMIARLEDAFRRQRQFTADASHELRTPLTAVKGQVEVALQRERSSDAYREVLRVVNQDVDRMARLIGSLLTLARADAGEIPIALEPISLADVVSGALEQVQAVAGQRGVALRQARESSVIVRADEDLLLQLLLNLLDNAIKHTPEHGEVTVGWTPHVDYVELWVRDTGIGIASEHLPHLFERFYRVDKARSRAEGGSGLGLSICRWIAEAHGGSIFAESLPGKGSTFTVRLPICS